MLSLLVDGFITILQPQNIIYLFAGVVLGLVMGAIPGLTSAMAIALIVPMTFTMTPTQSIPMLLGAYNAGTFGGSLSAILLSTPGTPAAGATVADGYGMAIKGRAIKAIKTALFSSIFGCMFSSIILIASTESIAKYALKFGPSEFAVLILFSLTIIASAAGDSLIKGLLAGIIGLLLGTVGLDPLYGTSRLTFSNPNLLSGINLVVMLIGCLAFGQILIEIRTIGREKKDINLLPEPKCKDDISFTGSDFKVCLPHWFRSSVIGCVIGALPGLGPTVAAYLGYDIGKRTSKHPEEFGKGSVEGVAAAEAANNAVIGANMIPLLSLGVPGDTGAAILIGAFLIQGLSPGPLIFTKNPDVVYNIYSGLIVANLLLGVITMLTYKYFTKISTVKRSIVFPMVCMFCMIGVYALRTNIADIWIMLFFAVIGYILTEFDFPIPCILIGFILSLPFEINVRQALLISGNSLSIFFKTPITWFFWACTVLSLFAVLRGKYLKFSKNKLRIESPGQSD